jgi:hypothetical protein
VEEEDVLTQGGIRATNNRGVGEGVAAVTGADDDDSWVIAIQNALTTGNTTTLAPMIQHGPPGASGNTLPQIPMGIYQWAHLLGKQAFSQTMARPSQNWKRLVLN